MHLRIFSSLLFSLSLSQAAVDTKPPQAAPSLRSLLVLNFSQAASPGTEQILSPEDKATLRKDVEGLLKALGIDLMDAKNAGSVPFLDITPNISKDDQEGVFLVSFRANLTISKDSKVVAYAGASRHRSGIVKLLRNRLCVSVNSLMRKSPGLVQSNAPAASFPSDFEFGRATPKETDFNFVRVKYQPPPPPNPRGAKTSPRAMSTVVVQITIDENGVPEMAEAKDGPDFMRMYAVQFAMRWRFEPQSENGKPVSARFRLNVVSRMSR